MHFISSRECMFASRSLSQTSKRFKCMSVRHEHSYSHTSMEMPNETYLPSVRSHAANHSNGVAEKIILESQCRSERLHTVETVAHKDSRRDGINEWNGYVIARARHRKCIKLMRYTHCIRATIEIYKRIEMEGDTNQLAGNKTEKERRRRRWSALNNQQHRPNRWAIQFVVSITYTYTIAALTHLTNSPVLPHIERLSQPHIQSHLAYALHVPPAAGSSS